MKKRYIDSKVIIDSIAFSEEADPNLIDLAESTGKQVLNIHRDGGWGWGRCGVRIGVVKEEMSHSVLLQIYCHDI